MKVTCLIENESVREDCRAEHGLSLYIEAAGHRILMDAGQSDLFLHNAEVLGIDLRAVDIAVLSHGHYDHGGGLKAFCTVNQKAEIHARREVFGAYFSIRNDQEKYIGLSPKLKDSGRFVLHEGNVRIDDSLFLFSDIGTGRGIPSANQRLKKKENGILKADDFRHEQCLVVSENGKKYLFSGCAHHGILNILDCFRNLFGEEPDAVFSGFHMVKKNGYSEEDMKMIMDTADELSELKTEFYTGHCTGDVPFQIMKEIMKDQLHELHCGTAVAVW